MTYSSIYILRLAKGKYYVGRSENPMARYEEHLLGEGSVWTRLFKPLGVIAVFPETSRWDEDRYVKEYMERHGIENVRGGSYSEIELSVSQKDVLRREIRGATDVCFRCGGADHFAADCTRDRPVVSSPKELVCFKCGFRGYSARDCVRCVFIAKVKRCDTECYNCGRHGHYARNCPYEFESDEEDLYESY